MKIRLLFAWYDFYIGIFYHKNKRAIYIFFLPMLGIEIRLTSSYKRRGVPLCPKGKVFEIHSIDQNDDLVLSCSCSNVHFHYISKY